MAHPYVVLEINPSSSTSATYELRRGGDGVLYCECRGWKNAKTAPKMCRHTKEYVAATGASYYLGRPNPGINPFTPLGSVKVTPGKKASVTVERPKQQAAGSDWRAQLLAEKKAAVARGVKQNIEALAAYSRDLDLDTGPEVDVNLGASTRDLDID